MIYINENTVFQKQEYGRKVIVSPNSTHCLDDVDFMKQIVNSFKEQRREFERVREMDKKRERVGKSNKPIFLMRKTREKMDRLNE